MILDQISMYYIMRFSGRDNKKIQVEAIGGQLEAISTRKSHMVS